MNKDVEKSLDEQNKKYGWDWEIEAIKLIAPVNLISYSLNIINPNESAKKIHAISCVIMAAPVYSACFKMINTWLNPSEKIALSEHEYDGKLQNEAIKTNFI